MMSINPFSVLAESVSPSVIQGFVLAMIGFNSYWNNCSDDPS